MDFDVCSNKKCIKPCEPKRQRRNTSQQGIARFKKEVRKGPTYVCVTCNRSLYKRNVQYFDENKYNIDNSVSMSCKEL